MVAVVSIATDDVMIQYWTESRCWMIICLPYLSHHRDRHRRRSFHSSSLILTFAFDAGFDFDGFAAGAAHAVATVSDDDYTADAVHWLLIRLGCLTH